MLRQIFKLLQTARLTGPLFWTEGGGGGGGGGWSEILTLFFFSPIVRFSRSQYGESPLQNAAHSIYGTPFVL